MYALGKISNGCVAMAHNNTLRSSYRDAVLGTPWKNIHDFQGESEKSNEKMINRKRVRERMSERETSRVERKRNYGYGYKRP